MTQEVTVATPPMGAAVLQKETFDQMYRMARLFASSDLVPAHYKGKEANCFIALSIAHRMREDPLTVMQNLYVVHGRPAWMTQYVIGRANLSGVFKGRITWQVEGSGDSLKVTAQATLAETGEQVKTSVDMKMAKAEGWLKNTKYQTMPEHMFKYRSAAFLIRLYAPEVMMGYQTHDEVETMVDVTPARNPSLIDNINQMIDGAEKKTESASPISSVVQEAIETITPPPAPRRTGKLPPTPAPQPSQSSLLGAEPEDLIVTVLAKKLNEALAQTPDDYSFIAALAIQCIENGSPKSMILELLGEEDFYGKLRSIGREDLVQDLMAA